MAGPLSCVLYLHCGLPETTNKINVTTCICYKSVVAEGAIIVIGKDSRDFITGITKTDFVVPTCTLSNFFTQQQQQQQFICICIYIDGIAF